MSNAEQAIRRITEWANKYEVIQHSPLFMNDIRRLLLIAQDATAKPRYEHDCDKCQYLGRYSDEQYDEADLYYCDREPTVIVRYADDGPSYSSGMVLADRGLNPALVEAKRRAIDKGLME